MRLAVFTKNLTNPAYAAARLGAERAAAAFGDVQVEHYVPEMPDDPQQQSALIDRALAARPDAIVLSTVHATLVNPAIERIVATGIPMVGFINPIPVGRSVSFVGADDAQLAREIAAYLFRHQREQGTVLVVSGPEQSVTSIDRLRGFADAIERHPRMNVVGLVVGDYSRTVAKARTADWLRTHAVPDACLVANDVMALGVLDALEEAKQRSVVVGVNAIPEAIAAIREGRLLATVDFSAMQIAFTATECAIRHLRGEAVPPQILLPAQIVDRGNYQEWDRSYEQRILRTLDEVLAG